MKKGETFFGDAKVLGKDHRVVYWPLRDGMGEVVGMFFVGKSPDNLRQNLIEMVIKQMAVASVVAFLNILVIVWAIQGLSGKIVKVATDLGISSETVMEKTSQIRTRSNTLSSDATQQASALEETSASMEEMSSMTKSNAENSHQAQGLANETRAAADSSLTSVQDMSVAMDDISKIIKKVDEIAFQTNILALNAAVEAARAGAAGLGFAVVADEVRNLAQNSANAARDISEKIEQGVKMSQGVQSGLTQIVEKIRRLTDIVNQTAASSNEQSQGIQQINTALTELDRVTQSNASSTVETAKATEELTQQADQLKESVSDLLGIIRGSRWQPSHLRVR